MASSNLSLSIWDNVKQVGVAVVLALLIKTSIVEAYKIPSQSMEDTLLVGDFLLANKFVYGAQLPIVGWRLPAIHDPEPGDVVIFIFPRDGVTKYIKRCVALAGDTITIKNKELFVNGVRFEDPEKSKFLKPRIEPRGPGGTDSPDNFGPFIVPPGHYFMMGDNRDNSYDSRWWGPVPQANILGEAMLIHWSWNDDIHPSGDIDVSDPLSVPRLFVHNAIYFFEKVRWNRLFNLIS